MIAILLFAALAAEGPPTTKPKMGPVEKEHKMVVDAVRGCPEREDEDEVVVCSRDRGISEGYRLPKLDPRFAINLDKNGRSELTDPALGATGAGSCTNVGAGGNTGCTLRNIKGWADEQKRKKAEDKAWQSPN
jgi:hypothetical protein